MIHGGNTEIPATSRREKKMISEMNTWRRPSSRIADRERPIADEPELKALVESLYFHEIQTREDLGQRLQIPLAVLIALAGIVGQMLQNMERGQTGNWVYAFWFAVTGCAGLLAAAFFFFVRTGWGHVYKYLPVAGDLENYRSECNKLYENYPYSKELVETAVRKAVYDRLVECVTVNSAINDHKSYNILILNRVLAFAAVFSFASFLFFYFGELDKKYQEIKIVGPLEVKGMTMANQKPPLSMFTQPDGF